MTSSDFLPADFRISEEAKRGIAIARAAFDAHSPDMAAVASVGWGLFTLNDGSQSENVVVSFYAKSQLAAVADAIQSVSGVDLVFFTTPFYSRKFTRRILDFADDRGFFLR